MSPQHDVIVIGGGHNGLACATYLAKAGLRVLVLERRSVVGGAAVTEEPWPGFQVSTASYVVSLMPPRVVEELELYRHGYKVWILEPDYYVPHSDGTTLALWGDVQRTADEIAKFSKVDADAYVEFDRYLSRLGKLMHELMFVVPPNLRLGELAKWAVVGNKLRHWTGRDIADAVRLFTLSGADFLDEWFTDERVKGALGTQAILGSWNGPMSPGSAYVLLHHWFGEVEGHEGAWAWVKGGMGGFSEVLATAARAAGVEIRTDASVRNVAIEAGRAIGVETDDGSVLTASRVISNAHPITTYLDLIGEPFLPAEVVRDIKRYRTRSGSVKVNLGLGELPVPMEYDGPVPGEPHTGIMAISPSLEYLERAWDDAKYGRCSEHPYVEAVFPTVFEPHLAPEGRHIALCFTQFGPFELADGTWDDERPRYGDRVIRALGESCPNLPGAVEHVEVLAPPDLEEKFGLLGGNIMQGEMSPDQMFSLRPIPGYGDHRTPIDGLYMCGSGTHPGGGVMGVPGRNCASVVAKDAKTVRERVTSRFRGRGRTG